MNPGNNINRDRCSYEEEKTCDPSWPICLYDTDEENLVSTIVLRTGDEIQIIEDYFFKVSSTSYGMFEMNTIYLKKDKKSDYKTDNKINNLDDMFNKDVELTNINNNDLVDLEININDNYCNEKLLENEQKRKNIFIKHII